MTHPEWTARLVEDLSTIEGLSRERQAPRATVKMYDDMIDWPEEIDNVQIVIGDGGEELYFDTGLTAVVSQTIVAIQFENIDDAIRCLESTVQLLKRARD